MIRFFLIFIIGNFVANIVTMRVGNIYNTSLVMNCTHSQILGSTCQECLCAMLYSSQNISIRSLNCHIVNNSAVRCELFTMANYLNSCSYDMQRNPSSTYYFDQLPPSNQFIPIATTTKESLTGKSLLWANVLRETVSAIMNFRKLIIDLCQWKNSMDKQILKLPLMRLRRLVRKRDLKRKRGGNYRWR